MEHKLSFHSDGLTLSAVLHVPEGRKPGQRLPAFIVLHGFVGSKDESHAEIQARMFEAMGYAALRFDFRCCGESEGERGQSTLLRPGCGRKERADVPRRDARRSTRSASVWSATVSGRPSLSTPPAWTSAFACVISSCGLGPWRAQIPRPTSNTRSVGEVHRAR